MRSADETKQTSRRRRASHQIGVPVRWTPSRHVTGAIVADTDTQTASTAEALKVVVEEFARLQRERVNAAESMSTPMKNVTIGSPKPARTTVRKSAS